MFQKIFLYALTFIFAISLIACGKITPGQNKNNPSNQKQAEPLATKEKIVTLKGKDLKGAELIGNDEQGRKLTFQVRDVEIDPKDPIKETYLYTVFYLDTADSKWKNLCDPDPEKIAKAIPLSGSWDETGAYIESSNLITFGCTSGVLAKCVRFGYKPWKNIQGKSLRAFYQACTRMVRADYCGNGKSHTREGTLINIYDVLDIQTQTPNDRGMVFEAAWKADGATCINHPRWHETLSDISKECPEKFKDGINEGGRCTTAQEAKQNFPDSLLFNDSLVRKPQGASKN